MRTSARIAVAFALVPSIGCAALGYDLSDYGGVSDDGGAPDASGGDATIDGDGGRDAGGDGRDAHVESGGVDASIDGPSQDAGAIDGGRDTGPDNRCSIAGGVKHVFVTGATYAIGDISSLTQADSLCATAARGVLEGTYLAWLSDDTTSAGARMAHSTVPYVLPDGVTIVACDWADFTNIATSHRHAIDQTANGGPAPTNQGCGNVADLAVWTGTEASGDTSGGHTCAGWTDVQGTGTMGFAHGIQQTWSDGCAGPICANNGALYCIEQ